MTTSTTSTSFLSDNVPPMGIYETLYAFRDAFGQFMGTEGTHPWSQGFPLTTPLEKFGGPELPSSVDVTWEDRFYPKAWGHPLAPGGDRRATTTASTTFEHHRTGERHGVRRAGDRGSSRCWRFSKRHVEVRIGNVEWPAYLDILTQTKTDWKTRHSDDKPRTTSIRATPNTSTAAA